MSFPRDRHLRWAVRIACREKGWTLRQLNRSEDLYYIVNANDPFGPWVHDADDLRNIARFLGIDPAEFGMPPAA